MIYTVKIDIDAFNVSEAKKVGKLLQNIVDKTDKNTKKHLIEQTEKNPDYFRKIAKQLSNPIVKKLIG